MEQERKGKEGEGTQSTPAYLLYKAARRKNKWFKL